MDNNSINMPECPSYRPPDILPVGYLDALSPLSNWIREQVRAAYMSGYADGRFDSSVIMGRRNN